MIKGAPANVLDYGADPTGATDSSAAFLAALLAASEVYVPQGTYQVSVTIPRTITYGPKKIFGAGTSETTPSGTILIPPPGKSYVIRVDASADYMQYFQMSNLNIANPNSVVSCIGLLFNGTDVSSISDYHTISNVNISGFTYGVQVFGRMIQSTWEQVYIDGCATGFYALPDPSSVAFILNTFINCRFNGCTNQGIFIAGWSLTNKFISCNFQSNNQGTTVGVAATHFTNAQNVSFDNCYWEGNGDGMAVDTVNPLNNSIGCYFDGNNFTSAPCITNSWLVGSGSCLVINGLVLLGGEISNTAVVPSTGGFGVAVLSSNNQGNSQSQFKIQSTGGQTFAGPDGGGQYMGYIEQQKGFYWGAPASINLAGGYCNFMVDAAAAPVTLPVPTNIISGSEMCVFAFGNTVTVPASVMYNTTAVTIASGTMKTFIGLGYPYAGKLFVKS
jgi:hypothetical protein